MAVLPELSINDILVDIKDKELNEFLINCQRLTSYLNRPVPKDRLKEHHILNNVYYLPISYMESMLDTIFFGLWKTTNFSTQVISNEIIGTIELHVYHPYLKQWITRVGTDALQIMVDSIPDEIKKGLTRQQKNEWALNPENKKPGALSNGGYAHLKADCFKNACLSIGKLFGRDVNREHIQETKQLVEPIKEIILRKRNEVSDLLSHNQDEEFKKIIIKEITDAEAENKNDLGFYDSIIKKLKNG